VVYWREPGTQHKDILKISKGGYVGPAVVLGQDQKFVDGTNQLRNRVWLLHGQTILVVAPAHLRPATDRQKLLMNLKDQDFPSLENILNRQGKKYLDLSGEPVPTPEDLERLYDGLSPENDEEREPANSDIPPEYSDIPAEEVPDIDIPDAQDDIQDEAPAQDAAEEPRDHPVVEPPLTPPPRAPRESPYVPRDDIEVETDPEFQRDLDDALQRLIGDPTPVLAPGLSRSNSVVGQSCCAHVRARDLKKS
jgi:hypothetical protein